MKFYGTLGPSCADRGTLARLLEKGMTGMRLNLSHSGLADCGEWIAALWAAAGETGRTPDFLIDLRGHQLRIEKPGEPIRLARGESVLAGVGGEARIRLPASLASRLEAGMEILLGDGEIRLAAEREMAPGPTCLAQSEKEKEAQADGGPGDSIHAPKMQKDVGAPLFLCTAETDAVVEAAVTVAIEGVEMEGLPLVSEGDLADLSLAARYGVTEVMVPFAHSGEDIRHIRALAAQRGLPDCRILAKIEDRKGLEKVSDIVEAADMVVVARGDLGNSIPLAQIPAAQKDIARACTAAGRPFMVVTQMLQSMLSHPVPTRAEVSDIFNAVLDGADALMLTAETAAGAYPVQAMEMLVRTARAASDYALYR